MKLNEKKQLNMGCSSSAALPEVPDEEKVKVIFVIGGPGSGKGTQCKKIKEKFGFEHKSTGDILRAVVEKKEHPGWEALAKKMNEGGFVSSEELLGFVADEFNSIKGKTVLLDGFPRNSENVKVWKKKMTGVTKIVGCLFFDCTDEEMKKRMLGRNEGRADDNEETMKKRIENFEKDTRPIASTFEKDGTLIKINAMQEPDKVFEEVQKAIEERKLA